MSVNQVEQILFESPIMSFWLDDELKYIGCNRLTAEYGQLKHPNDIEGKTDFDLPWAKFAEKYRSDDAKVLQGESLDIIELFVINSCVVTVKVRKIPYTGSDGSRIKVIGYTEIISEVKNDKKVLKYLKDSTNEQYPYPITQHMVKQCFGLTFREAIALYYVVRGCTLTTSADEIYRSWRTVESSIQSVKEKWGCDTKEEVIIQAHNNGFVYFIPESLLN